MKTAVSSGENGENSVDYEKMPLPKGNERETD